MNLRNLFKPRQDLTDVQIDVTKASAAEIEAESRRLAEIAAAIQENRRILAKIAEAKRLGSR